MGKVPYFPFYPGDWLRDGVSGCSLSAQGLWLRMMILAHDSDRYGYLELNGSPMHSEHIARRCGTSLGQYETLLSELSDAGVPSRTPEGIIYSRRMARDARDRANDASRQRKSRSKRGNVRHADVTTAVTPLSECENEFEVEPVSEKEKVRILYEIYPKKVGKADALRAIRRALSKASFEVLREAVSAYSAARAGEDQQYTPNPSTWFNQERWNDDRSTWRSNRAFSRGEQREQEFADAATGFLYGTSPDKGRIHQVDGCLGSSQAILGTDEGAA